ncbi:MAG: NUDIX hydrolase [Bdellovibrionales bacterium]|nr:NUDIX hydrolase [Bdellovibrionales bacterium]
MIKRKLVYIYPYTKDKKVLIQDRRSISKFGEEWGAFGGQVEAGEDIQTAVKREALEELGISLLNPRHIGFFECQNTYKGNLFDVEIDVFTSLLETEIEELQVMEGDGCALYDLAEAKKLKFVHEIDYKIIDCVFKSLI